MTRASNIAHIIPLNFSSSKEIYEASAVHCLHQTLAILLILPSIIDQQKPSFLYFMKILFTYVFNTDIVCIIEHYVDILVKNLKGCFKL